MVTGECNTRLLHALPSWCLILYSTEVWSAKMGLKIFVCVLHQLFYRARDTRGKKKGGACMIT